MILLWHLILGNFFFVFFIIKNKEVLQAYERSRKVIALNKLLKEDNLTDLSREKVSIEAKEDANFMNKKWNIFTYIIFYLQFVVIAWLLFLATFASAVIIVYLNPKIKELL